MLYKGKDCFSLDSLPSQVIKTFKKIAKSFLWNINTDILCLWKGYQISRVGPKEEMSSGVSSLVYKEPVITFIIEQSIRIGLLENSSYGNHEAFSITWESGLVCSKETASWLKMSPWFGTVFFFSHFSTIQYQPSSA